MNKEIDNQLISRNIKPTAMRQLVLRVLMEQNVATSLLDLERKFERADKATLYRTLKTFEEKKLIHSIIDGSGSVKYALCHKSCECTAYESHVHFYCVKCKHTYCLDELPIPSFQLPKDFSLESMDMVVKGVCSNC